MLQPQEKTECDTFCNGNVERPDREHGTFKFLREKHDRRGRLFLTDYERACSDASQIFKKIKQPVSENTDRKFRRKYQI